MNKKSNKIKYKKKKIKHRYLYKKYQFNTRKEFHESEDYINGVISDGEMVMRPLTEDEKEWLNKFNKENLCATFDTKDSEINNGIESTDFHKDIASRKTIRNENYIRNNDLYNQKKITGFLKKLDTDEYDKISESRLSSVDVEDYLVSQIDLKNRLKEMGYFNLRKVDLDLENEIRELAIDFDLLPLDKEDLLDGLE